jgi:DNA-binding MarR family transcriptional regulator
MSDPARLEDHIGYWLRIVSNATSQGFARKVEAEGVTVAEWVVMRMLYDVEVVAPSELAMAMGMTRGAISKLADRLAEKGLVARSGDLADGRAKQLSLTPPGRAKVPALAALADANEAEFFGALSEKDRTTLTRILRTLAAERGNTAVPID